MGHLRGNISVSTVFKQKCGEIEGNAFSSLRQNLQKYESYEKFHSTHQNKL